MNNINLTILLCFLTLIFFTDCQSQETEILKGCRVISIDTFSFLPDYYVISVNSGKGRILLLSSFEKSILKTKEIKKNKKYDFEIEKLDSVLINLQDSIYYFSFDIIRGGNGNLTLFIDGEGPLKFEDFNYKPFRALNLKGLEYIEVGKSE